MKNQKMTQAQKVKAGLLVSDSSDAQIFVGLEDLGAEKEVDATYGTTDFTFADGSIIRFTCDETFISL